MAIPLLTLAVRAQEVTAPEITVVRSGSTTAIGATNLIDGSAALEFGSRILGSAGVTQYLTIKNIGTATLSNLAVVVDGNHAADFAVSNLEVTSLAPGISRTFSVTFKPKAVGARTAILRIASNDADENPFDIKLYGTGLEEAVTAPEITVVKSTTTSPAGATNLIDGSAALEFGSRILGSTGVSQFLTIKNIGTATLSNLAVVVDGSHAADFTVSNLEVTSLAPGISRTFSVTFKPNAVGARTANLRIASNDADENPFDIKLYGTGLEEAVTAPEITVVKSTTTSPTGGINLIDGSAALEFGSRILGTAGVSQFLTIKNIGTATLSNLAVVVDGNHAADFTVSNLEVTSLAPGIGRTLMVTFKPNAVGARTAILRIASNDADENPFDIKLYGTGLEEAVTAPEITVMRSESMTATGGTNLIDGSAALEFGSRILGSAGVSQFLTIKNIGTATLSNLAVVVDGNHAADFTVSNLEVTSLAPGISRTFSVTFKPKAVGARTAVLRIASNDADENPFDIKLYGTGLEEAVTVPEITVVRSELMTATGGTNLIDGSAALEFGSRILGTAGVSQFLTIKNIGTATLSNLAVVVDGNHAADFTVSNLEVTSLAPGISRTFSVTFKPKAVGARTAILRIASNDADENPFDIKLYGTGREEVVTAPEITVVKSGSTNATGATNLIDGSAVLQFESRILGTAGVSQFLTIKNIGTATLSNLAVVVDGNHAADFTVSNLEVTSLAPGISRTFSVTFKPKAVGARTANLRIASNDADENPFDIKLYGTGLEEVVPGIKSDGTNLSITRVDPDLNPAETQIRPVISTILIDGLKYRCITIQKTVGVTIPPDAVEVSADLDNWFSGKLYTTVVKNNAKVLQVRDNTPLTREVKRYIRLKKRP